MSQAHGSSTPPVLVVGDAEAATTLVSTLESDGLTAIQADTAPEALATLDAATVGFLVVVDDDGPHPVDVFGAAAQRGHRLPGLFVASDSQSLPPGVEQVPDADAAAAAVRQRLLSDAAVDADPVVEKDPLAAFGSTVSHELRNHLGAARLAVESLEGETTEQALSALDRLESLASEAEAVASKEVTATEPVSVSAAAAEATDRLRMADANVDVSADGTVEADEELLTLLLENLFRNSIEHGSGTSQASPADQDGAELTIQVIDTEEGFAVVDNGPGFASQNPFAWGYTTGEGQGAGLAVVQRIAETHGWEIAASNDDGARIDVMT
jgi:signal transduction histidine kinase